MPNIRLDVTCGRWLVAVRDGLLWDKLYELEDGEFYTDPVRKGAPVIIEHGSFCRKKRVCGWQVSRDRLSVLLIDAAATHDDARLMRVTPCAARARMNCALRA